jgi:hypothetical protein
MELGAVIYTKMIRKIIYNIIFPITRILQPYSSNSEFESSVS